VKEEMDKRPWERSAECDHADEQRVLTGTWCSPELHKAVEMGYEIQYIYEVWQFNETCEGLFRDYVNTWLKIKQEASGWPSWVGDDESKRQQYLREYEEHEGIQLEYDKIEHNAGLRTLAKMMLNSMWGKFGQPLNETQVKAYDDPQAFHRFLDTDTMDVRHVSVINDAMVELHYQYQDEDIPVSPHLNIFVAAFTTCWARLRLYAALERLGERVLYYDTDLVIYLEEEGQPNPVLGDYLGDFTSELEEDDHIVEFASGGPKNYGPGTPWTKSKSPSRTHAKPKSSKATRLSETPNTTSFPPFPIPRVTNWCTTRESSIPRPFKRTLTDTEPPAKIRLHPSLQRKKPSEALWDPAPCDDSVDPPPWSSQSQEMEHS